MTNPHLSRLPRGEALIEWVEGGVRFGICQESEGVDSWYIVSDDGTDDCGTLPPNWINWGAILRTSLPAGDVERRIPPTAAPLPAARGDGI